MIVVRMITSRFRLREAASRWPALAKPVAG
jgi:hypothetical protein